MERVKRAIREVEQHTGKKNIHLRRKFNRMLKGGGAPQSLTYFIENNIDLVKDKYPYLLNKDGSVPSFTRETSVGGFSRQGDLFKYKDRNWIIKIGCNNRIVENTYGQQESINNKTYVENFYYDRPSNPNQTEAVKIQNILNKYNFSPMVIASGMFKGFSVVIMEEIENAKTLKERKTKNKIKILRQFEKILKKLSICHNDLHTENVVHGTLGKKRGYFLIDFDNSFMLDDSNSDSCNDSSVHEDIENTEPNVISFKGTVTMPTN